MRHPDTGKPMRTARKPARFEICITVDIAPGSPALPVLRLLCGDTLFLNLPAGHSARWSTKRVNLSRKATQHRRGGRRNVLLQELLNMKPLTRNDLPAHLPWTPRMVEQFFSAYLECALWSSLDESDESGGEPLDANYGPEDIPEDVRERLRAECVEFIAANHEMLDYGGWTPEQAGHDFWLTRNGHGTGFRDRGKGEVGKELADAAHVYGGVDLYVGDDGKVWAAGYEAPRPRAGEPGGAS